MANTPQGGISTRQKSYCTSQFIYFSLTHHCGLCNFRETWHNESIFIPDYWKITRLLIFIRTGKPYDL